MEISAKNITATDINEFLKTSNETVTLTDVLGERFIACGLKDKTVKIYGTPGNALGAYLDGATVDVFGNGQDAVGDTMNAGAIIIRGSAGDALGYAMRGGEIFVRGDAGYRIGVHMKEYHRKKPVIIIGGTAGSFLGEYMAGGIIIILNLNNSPSPVGNFTGVGMHGGKIFIRGALNASLPPQVKCEKASTDDLDSIKGYLKSFSDIFGLDINSLTDDSFSVLSPDSTNPYKRLYTNN